MNPYLIRLFMFSFTIRSSTVINLSRIENLLPFRSPNYNLSSFLMYLKSLIWICILIFSILFIFNNSSIEHLNTLTLYVVIPLLSLFPQIPKLLNGFFRYWLKRLIAVNESILLLYKMNYKCCSSSLNLFFFTF